MLSLFKKIFNDPDKETIKIFEETTKIEYSQDIFLALKAISLTNVNLKNLKPISVFKNLEILNLANNRIKDISCLKDLDKIKILDLRFNKIEKLPPWVFESRKKLYWSRHDENQEGIFLEGNPLNRSFISKLKRNTNRAINVNNKADVVLPSLTPSKSLKEITKLLPLNRQQVSIFSPQNFKSSLVEQLDKSVNINSNGFRLNIFQYKYNREYEILNTLKEPLLYESKYNILILKSVECCLNPPILTRLLKIYPDSKIFLIIEDESKKDIEDKIEFFKTYNKSNNIEKIYHIYDLNSSKLVRDKIYNYLKDSKEAKSLWKRDWISIRDEIERDGNANLDKNGFYSLASKYHLSKPLTDELYNYLKMVGVVCNYSRELYKVSGFI